MTKFGPGQNKILERVLWAAVLVFLPVTSFRFLPFFGDAQVKPLSFVPAVFLFLLLVWQSICQKKVSFWTPALVPLLVFGFVALMATIVGLWLAPPDLNQHSFFERALRAWITFGVGVLFLLVAIAEVKGEEDLGFTLKWLYIGLVGHVLVAVAQWVEIHYLSVIFEDLPLGNLVDTIQKTVLMAGISPNKRISGLALEPSWLAAQIASLYLPWVVASLLSAYAWLKRRFLVYGLFGVLVVMAVLTYSRAGLVIMVVSGLGTLLPGGRGRLARVWEKFAAPFKGGVEKKSLRIAIRLAGAGLVLAGLVMAGKTLAENTYFASLWQARSTGLVDYFVDIYAGPRLAYAQAGWTVFTEHPWLGVGLGGGGLYIHAAIPTWAHFNSAEMARLFSPEFSGYPNVKNLYLRLLAETGFMGLWAFLSFLAVIFGKILTLLRWHRTEIVFLATASLFSFISILGTGFSMDSLAMPMTWIPFGILLGMADALVD